MKFATQLYFKIENLSGKISQFDCQTRLILAQNEEEAYFLAKEIGLNEESEFINEKGETVKWIFAGITEIKELNTDENGARIFSSTIETDPKDRFLDYVRTKSKDLALNLSKKELIFSL